MKTGNRTVDKMMQMHLTGNVTPMSWYQTITRENGKPHLAAIAILSDIVYWYRPREVRDEQSGKLLGFEKRFWGDLLQRGYGQLAEQFGLSKRQVMAAVTALEELGVIKKVLRNTVIGGMMAGNVMFLDLNVERLIELTLIWNFPAGRNARTSVLCPTRTRLMMCSQRCSYLFSSSVWYGLPTVFRTGNSRCT